MWMDGDMLVIGDLRGVMKEFEGLVNATRNHGPSHEPQASSWRLHGSSHDTASRIFNSGFFLLAGVCARALTTHAHAPPSILARASSHMQNTTRSLAHVRTNADHAHSPPHSHITGPVPSPVIEAVTRSLSLSATDRFKTCRWLDKAAGRSQCGDQALLRHALETCFHPEGKIVLHADWQANYRPENDTDLDRYRAVHWMGARKPWGDYGPYLQTGRVPPRMDAAWQDEWNRVQLKCNRRDVARASYGF